MSPLRSLGTIFILTLLISGTSWGIWGGLQYWKHQQEIDPRYTIRAVMTKSIAGEPIRPSMAVEWLNLSVDRKKNLYSLNLNEAKRRIERQLPVKKARVRRIPPSTLLVEVEMRQPIAFVGERSNIAIDLEGNVFPLVPFYTPKKLPRLFIGSKKNFSTAIAILKWLVKEEKLDKVDLIDVEKATSLSFGEREIVISYNGQWVRLNAVSWQEGLNKMFKLRHVDAKIVDLRIEDLALITK